MSEYHAPAAKGHFLLGSLLPFLRHQLNYLLHISNEYGDFVNMKILGQDIYLINNPSALRNIFVTQSENFKRTSRFKRVFQQIVGEGLMTLEGKAHQHRRQFVQPAFHHGHLHTYAAIMVERTTAMLKQWDNGQIHDLSQTMMPLTLDIVSRTLFGTDLADELVIISDAILTSMGYFAERLSMPIPSLDWLPTRKNQSRRNAKRLLDKTILKIIKQRRASGEVKDDLLSMLLFSPDKNDEYLTDEEILTEALTFLVSGHETTANVLTWALYLIAKHPDVEAKLLAEIDTVLGASTPDLSHYPQLTYIEMVIKETMRLYPSVWVTSRIATTDTEIEGQHLKKNSVVLACPYTMHRNEQYFPEPERFLPERFADDFEKTLPKYAYFPFGGGERTCIGKPFALMEIRLVLATILQRYRLELISQQEVEPLPLVTLRPNNTIAMRVVQREK